MHQVQETSTTWLLCGKEQISELNVLLHPKTYIFQAETTHAFPLAIQKL